MKLSLLRLSSLFSRAHHLSEIYNETGYDLLDPGREVRALEDLPKVGGAGGGPSSCPGCCMPKGVVIDSGMP